MLEVSDRLHLTSREFEQLIEATQGQQERGARPLLVAPDVPAWLAGVGGCRMKLDQVDTESRVLHVARLKGRVIDDTPYAATS